MVLEVDPSINYEAVVKALLIFESVSDLVVSTGFEKPYGFLKAEKEILAKEPNATFHMTATGSR